MLTAAIDNLKWNPRGLGLIDPFGPADRHNANEANRAGSGEARQEQRAETADERAYVRLNSTSGALEVLGRLMDELRPVSGRKSEVFFSDGLYLPGLDLLGEHNQMANAELMRTYFRRLVDRANRAGAVVYTVDSRGLVPLSPQQGGSLYLSQEGMLQLAADTGGFAALTRQSGLNMRRGRRA